MGRIVMAFGAGSSFFLKGSFVWTVHVATLAAVAAVLPPCKQLVEAAMPVAKEALAWTAVQWERALKQGQKALQQGGYYRLVWFVG